MKSGIKGGLLQSSSHAQMWELDLKEGYVPKNWCFWTAVLEKTLESSLDSEEIRPVNPKVNQPWIFIRRTDTETSILWPLLRRANLLEKTLILGKTEGRRRRGWEDEMDERYEMVGWYYQLNGHELEQTWRDSEGEGSLVCCSPRGHKELDTVKWLNNNFKAASPEKWTLLLRWLGYKFGQPLWSTERRFLKKTKNRIAVWASSPPPEHISRENSNLERYLNPSVHAALFTTIYKLWYRSSLNVLRQVNG